VVNPTATGVELGAAGKVLSRVSLGDVKVYGAAGVTGIAVRANDGTIGPCQAPGALDGLSILGSTDVVVTGGDYKDCTGNGINAESSTRCTIIGPDCRGSVTAVRKVSATTLEACGVLGDLSRTPDQQRWKSVNATSSNDAETTMDTYTIPANTLSKPGDGFKILVKASGTTDLACTVRVHITGAGGPILAAHVISAHASLNDAILIAEVRVNSVGVNGVNNIGSTVYGLNDSNLTPTVDNLTVTANMTIDQTLAITLDKAGVSGTNVALDLWKIEYIGGQFV
jgi:hypothetical protein